MVKRLFEPLGMTSAGFGSPGHPGKVDQPWGHLPQEVRSGRRKLDNAPVHGTGGNRSLLRARLGQIRRAPLASAQGKPKLLKAATFRALHTPPPGHNYAGGWTVVGTSLGQRPHLEP